MADTNPSSGDTRILSYSARCDLGLPWVSRGRVEVAATKESDICVPRPFSEPPPFRTYYRQIGDECFLLVSGDLDMATSRRLEELLEIIIHEHGTDAAVRMDLSGLAFIDTSALQVVERYGEILHAGGGSMTISAAAPRVRRLLELLAGVELAI